MSVSVKKQEYYKLDLKLVLGSKNYQFSEFKIKKQKLYLDLFEHWNSLRNCAISGTDVSLILIAYFGISLPVSIA